jgi:uncharacterized protein YaaQ
MKLLLAIVRDDSAADVIAALNEEGLSVTRVSTTGGFWRRGNVTLLIGLDETEVERGLEIINAHAGPEVEQKSAPDSHRPHRVTIFVLDVDAMARY